MQHKGKNFLLALIFICLIASLIYAGLNIYRLSNELSVLQIKNNQLQEQQDKIGSSIQQEEFFTILIADWAKEDGYSSVEEWEKDIQKYRKQYLNCYKSFLETDIAQFTTEEQKQKMEKLEGQIQETRSAKKLKELIKKFDLTLEEVKQKGDEEVHVEPIEITEDYPYQEENSYQNENSNSDNTSGLTEESGVNYYDGRTETYYSSNVLYHYRTDEWTVDDEGFYRTDEGYYVVAASDMEQGTTFEGSKGTCIVLDSGCDAGVTDYYVAF